MHAFPSSRAITHVNNFEHKWKIKTNKDKFQVINIGRHSTVDILHHNIEHSTSGKVLGFNIYSTSIAKHVAIRRNITTHNLTNFAG